MKEQTEKKAVVLLGHGSKKKEANEILSQLAKMLEKESYDPVFYSFLQFTSPTLEDTIDKIAGYSVQEITIVPVFLFPGVHLQQDIPEEIEELKYKYPGISFNLSGPIGADKRLIPILKDKIDSSAKSP